MSVLIPVSIGELIDKITILEIKKEKIYNTDKLKNIDKELNLLQNILCEKKFVFETNLKSELKDINKQLWDIENCTREKEKDQIFDAEFIHFARNVYILNDLRAKIKKEINVQTNSEITEEKEHNLKKALFLSHLGMGDHIMTNGLVRSFIPFFDIIYVVVKNNYLSNVTVMFSDTLKIKFLPVDSDFYNLSMDNEYKKTFLDKVKNLKIQHLILSGVYGSNYVYDFPLSFYDELEVPRSYFHEKFYISTPDSAVQLYKKLNGIKFIFTHLSSSNSILQNGIQKVENIFSFDKNEILVIDPNKNHYLKEEKFFCIAEQCLNKPIFDYIEIIKNAEKIAVTDSSFFCLSLLIPLKTKDCILFPRDNITYSWLFDNKHINSFYVISE